MKTYTAPTDRRLQGFMFYLFAFSAFFLFFLASCRKEINQTISTQHSFVAEAKVYANSLPPDTTKKIEWEPSATKNISIGKALLVPVKQAIPVYFTTNFG